MIRIAMCVYIYLYVCLFIYLSPYLSVYNQETNTGMEWSSKRSRKHMMEYTASSIPLWCLDVVLRSLCNQSVTAKIHYYESKMWLG